MPKHLNPDDPKASASFCGLITTAASVFTYRLGLGGMYSSTEHFNEIHEHITALMHLIDGYEATDINL